MVFNDKLKAHLSTGITTVARAWAVTRADGTILGFTDHDRDLVFDQITFRADTGLSALAVEQSSGLSVDNTEALGALRDDAVTEADIVAGRYDGASVVAWLVDWTDTDAREIVFRGTIGEIERSGQAFKAELRGLSEALNRPLGRVFQAPCSAVLGDANCAASLDHPAYRWEGPVETVTEGRRLTFAMTGAFDADWFQRGTLTVLSGGAQGLTGLIKRDVDQGGGIRLLELWTELRADLKPKDHVRITAGCDKRFETCQLKFNNILNFRGFPDIPTEDWVAAHPAAAAAHTGGSRR